MLPPSFLAAQERTEFRDVVNFIHGFVARTPHVLLHLEATDGVARARKINYTVRGKTILALWLLRTEFRLEVQDPARKLHSPNLFESGAQFETKGWRNYKFDPLNPNELTEALRLIEGCIALHA